MINFDSTGMSKEFAKAAPIECAMYLYNCLPKEKQDSLKKEWDDIGGTDAMYWYQFILNNVSVMADKDLVKETGSILDKDSILNKNENKKYNLNQCTYTGVWDGRAYTVTLNNNEDIIRKLLASFPKSSISMEGEFIANNENDWFNLKNCESELDVKCKVLEHFSRGAFKSNPHVSQKSNDAYHVKTLLGINAFLGTTFTMDNMEMIYTRLGNQVNRPLTIDFINSGYDLSVLTKDKDIERLSDIELE